MTAGYFGIQALLPRSGALVLRMFVGTGGVVAEPTQELLMKHRSYLVDALSVHSPRNERSDLGTAFVRGFAAFEQIYPICVFDRARDDCDDWLGSAFPSPTVKRVRHNGDHSATGRLEADSPGNYLVLQPCEWTFSAPAMEPVPMVRPLAASALERCSPRSS